jgi:hypothetical protein
MLIEEKLKTCRTCKENKKLSCYTKYSKSNRTRKDCKVCISKISRKRFRELSESDKEIIREKDRMRRPRKPPKKVTVILEPNINCDLCLQNTPKSQYVKLSKMCKDCANTLAYNKLRRCSICKEIKPLMEYGNKGAGRIRSECKTCAYKRAKVYSKTEKAIINTKKYREKHYNANKQQILEKSREWRERNKVALAEKRRTPEFRKKVQSRLPKG